VTRDSAGPSDAELLQGIAGADQWALHELYARHAPWLVLRLRRRCSDPDVVAEAVQDTFLAVWRKPQSYSGAGEVAAWIWGIGIRRLIGSLRKVSRRAQPEPTTEQTTPSAEERVLIGVEHGDLAGALDRLSPELRAVVRATILDGLTNREAAKLLGIPTGTLKTRMARARVELREALA
jgi:RNA polymerase sigma-70 factor, ECF subfamily